MRSSGAAAIIAFTVATFGFGCGQRPSSQMGNIDQRSTPAAASGPVNAANDRPKAMHPSNDLEKRIYAEYGAVFFAGGEAVSPDRIIFENAATVDRFQKTLRIEKAEVGGVSIELQAVAMHALEKAVAEAKMNGLTISPRGSDAAGRSYDDTVKLWESRVTPALDHWQKLNKITAAQADAIRGKSPSEQVEPILMLESQGLFFSKDLSRSILYSVAAPGTSQHLSLLALDINEFDDKRVRQIMAENGWFQTVISDLPHFTYLGVKESELESLGLKRRDVSGRTFWTPAD